METALDSRIYMDIRGDVCQSVMRKTLKWEVMTGCWRKRRVDGKASI
jgi:hypothetical protein